MTNGVNQKGSQNNCKIPLAGDQTSNSLIVLPVPQNFLTDRTINVTSDVGQCDKNEAAWTVQPSDGPKILNFKEGNVTTSHLCSSGV